MDKVNNILKNMFKVDAEKLTDDIKMKDLDRWDSLSHMELITSLEEGLNIQFSMEEIMKMTSIGKIKEVVKKKLEK